MKILYRVSDGTILAFNWSDGIGQGEELEDFEGEIPSLRADFFKRNDKGEITEKTEPEKEAIRTAENADKESLTQKLKFLGITDKEINVLVKK